MTDEELEDRLAKAVERLENGESADNLEEVFGDTDDEVSDETIEEWDEMVDNLNKDEAIPIERPDVDDSETDENPGVIDEVDVMKLLEESPDKEELEEMFESDDSE